MCFKGKNFFSRPPFEKIFSKKTAAVIFARALFLFIQTVGRVSCSVASKATPPALEKAPSGMPDVQFLSKE